MNPDEQVVCMACSATFKIRDLERSTETVARCRKCGHVVEGAFGFSDPMGQGIDEIARIDEWVDSLRRVGLADFVRRSEGETLGDYFWESAGGSWTIQLAYFPRQLWAVEMRLVSNQFNEALEAGVNDLIAIAAKHGVQFEGRLGVAWRMYQLLHVNQLPPEVFPVVRHRLDAAMQEATSYLSHRSADK